MEKNLSKKLEQLISNGTQRNPLPMVKGNSIRIGKVVVRYSQAKGYILFDCLLNEQFYIAHSKPGALAIAKQYNGDKPIDKCKIYDKEYSKHDSDCIFYEHTQNVTSDAFRKDLAAVRLGVSQAMKENAYQKLEAIIFD